MAALCRTGTPFLGNDQRPYDMRTDAGVVDRGGLENRCASNSTQGSNPCLSANFCLTMRAEMIGDSRADAQDE
jgi:hypothetical protein